MKFLGLSALVLMLSGTASANDSKEFLRCQSTSNEEMVVEVDSNLAALFDNDSWTIAPFVYQIESLPIVDFFGIGGDDGFSLEIRRSDMFGKQVSATVFINSTEETHTLTCKTVTGESFLDSLE